MFALKTLYHARNFVRNKLLIHTKEGMKTKIKEALKTRYKALGFSDAAIEAVATFLEATVTEEPGIDAAVAGVEGLLKAVQSDTDKARNDKAKAEAKLAELEKAHPAPAPAIPPAPVPDDTPAWAKTIIESNKALSAKIATIEGEKTSNNRKLLLEAAFPENTPSKYRDQTIKGLDRQTFETEEEFTAYITDVKATAEELAGLATTKGSVFKRPAGGGGEPPKDKISEEVAARIKARETETVPDAISGLPKK